MPGYSRVFVPILDLSEALAGMAGLIEELQGLTKTLTKEPVDRATAKKISANLRMSLGHIDTLEYISKNQDKKNEKKELLLDEERDSMAARIKEMETKMEEERTAMTNELKEMKSKHDEEVATLKKDLSTANDSLLSQELKLYNLKTELADAQDQARRKPTYSVPPHLRKPADATHFEAKKKLDALALTHDTTLKTLDAAQAALLAKDDELATFRRYHASVNEAFTSQLYGANAQLRELAVQKHLVEHALQHEQHKAAGFLLQLDDAKRALANATEACEGTAGCTSCVQHLRVALRVAQAHEAEAGRLFDAMWVAQLRATEGLAAVKAGIVVSAAVGEEGEGEGEVVAGELSSEKKEDVDSSDDDDDDDDDDDSEFEIITGC